jgi:hypothetical protein
MHRRKEGHQAAANLVDNDEEQSTRETRRCDAHADRALVARSDAAINRLMNIY